MILWLAILNFLFAVSFVIAKIGIYYITPLYFVAVRMIVAAAVLYGYVAITRVRMHIKLSDYRAIFLLSLFHIFIPYCLEFWALKYLDSTTTSLLYSITPLIAALIGWTKGVERFTVFHYSGIGIGVLGSLLYAVMSGETVGTMSSSIYWPECALFIAIWSSAYGWFLLKELVVERGYSVLLINSMAMGIGGILALVIAISLGNPFFTCSPTAGSVLKGFSAMGALIITANCISYNVYGYLFNYFSATFISATGMVIPLITALFGYLFLGETISLPFFISFLIIMCGLLLFYYGEQKKKAT